MRYYYKLQIDVVDENVDVVDRILGVKSNNLDFWELKLEERENDEPISFIAYFLSIFAMKKILILILVFNLFKTVSAQQENILNDYYATERRKNEIYRIRYSPQDTIKLFLDDKKYYIANSKSKLCKYFEENKNNSYSLEFELRDSLPNGFYCLYNITKGQTDTIKNIEEYLVVSGEFKNGMKQDMFVFGREFVEKQKKYSIEYYMNIHSYSNEYREITFKNDTVHGRIKEVKNGKIIFLGEYNMGVKDGFFYYEGENNPAIFLYENGVKVKETYFLSNEYTVADIPQDTIKLYLNDTKYYTMDTKLGYRFELKDGLEDGFYCLYNITKKQAKKIKNKEKQIIVSGEFKNGMKQGIFVFKREREFSETSNKYREISDKYSEIFFKNDLIHGIIKNFENNKVTSFEEYNMGMADGFFYCECGGYPIISLYKNDEMVREIGF